MNDQMEQIWRSKDGQCTGSKEEVEAYLATLDPLKGMRFPYAHNFNGIVTWVGLNETSKVEKKAVIAFANLAPLIHEAYKAWENEWRGDDWRGSVFTEHWHNEVANLLLAYEEALKQVPQ